MKLTVNLSGANEMPEHTRMLVAGTSGVGKTRFALTSPAPIFANCYGGTPTLALYSGTPFVNITCEQDLLNLKFALDCDDRTREERFGREVSTLVIDTVDAFQRVLVTEKMAKDRKDEFGPSDWMWLGQRCNAIFEGLSQLPMNVVLLMHTKTDTDGERFWLKPGVQGAFTEQITQYVDYALLLRADCEVQAVNEAIDYEGLTISGSQVTGLTNIKVSYSTDENRWLVSKPTSEYEWLFDYSNTLPQYFALNFRDDFQRIVEARKAVADLPDSESYDLEIEGDAPSLERTQHKAKPKRSMPKRTEPMTAQEEAQITRATTEVDCTDCGKKVETQDWVHLSKMRYSRELCKGCYTTRTKRG